MGDEITISVATICYNHGAYIAEAIESVLAQKCSYKIEMIISDDCSTDDSRAIISKYAASYPDIIKPIYNEKNIGAQNNASKNLSACKGKYIAALEGDDYWCDPYKLQKQVDFLEVNEDYSLCFTSIDVIDERGHKFNMPSAFLNFTKNTYALEDIICHPVDLPLSLPTMTLVFRNILPNPMPKLYTNALQGDTALTLLLGATGKFKYLPEKTAVYRQHNGGVTKSKEFQFKFDRSMFDLMDSFNEYSNHKYNNSIQQKLYPLSKTLLMYGSSLLKGEERKEHITRMLKGYKKYRPTVNIKEMAYYKIVLFFPFVLKMHKFLFQK